jgi:hypothetical protein
MKKIFKKILITVSVVAVSAVLVFLVAWQIDLGGGREPAWGATFSEYYAKEFLRLDWEKAYTAILDELPFKKYRLVAYWQYLEPEEGRYNFQNLDWQMNEAQKRGKEITLAIGYRMPRWPECHAPEWAKKLPLDELRRNLLEYMGKVVDRYKNYDILKAWQVENEPFLSTFGECPPPDEQFLQQEINLVKSLDPQRLIMVTDSGELSLWLTASKFGDTLGTTLYRIVYSPYFKRFKHFIPPSFYGLRAAAAGKISGTKDVIVSELQAEPWAPNTASISFVPFDDQTKDFTLEDMKDNIAFTRKTGLKEAYLWGPEWWYYREVHGDPSWMEFGKTLK